MSFIAHSANSKGEFHSLIDHLFKVSDKMISYSVSDDYSNIFRITGLLHDFGKYQPAFQKYLKEGGRKGSVPHAIWGAVLAGKYKQIEAAFAIDGHHKGLPDLASLQDDCAELDGADNIIFNELEGIFLKRSGLLEKDLKYNQLQIDPTERELLIRYIFSALTDADWLDTEKHFNSELSEHRKVPDFNASILIKKIEEEIAGKSKEGNLNRLRNRVRDFAVAKAHDSIGFYSMTLPTGMGKTLASLSWALHHARYNCLKRIIIVLPFLSIIDQTAKELKRIFGEEMVLEHHSNFNEDEFANKQITRESFSSEDYPGRLATENWDFPIIITTSVQFFESLFGNKPSRCRKVHNIAQSVVIFDEVQTLPKELVLPTLTMLRNVQRIMCTSFLLCTATQPAFGKTDNFNGIENIVSLVENPKVIFDATKRVKYSPINQYKPVTISELANLVLGKKISSLIIFNTKKQTFSFYKEIRPKIGFKAFHLSTGMYPIHRKRVIEDIRKCLNNKEKIVVVSTQLIEAGVDLDFPCVFREIAPLESVIQSAGRCNREGKMNKPGDVYIFSISLEERPGPMKQYYSLADFANSLYNGKEELLFEHDFFGDYYRKAFQLFIPEDKYKIEQNRSHFNFEKVANSYHLIGDVTTPVFILCDDSKNLYERIRYKSHLSRADYRAMQQFSVQVYENFLKENITRLGREPQGYWLWHGDYSNEYGISTENPTHIL
jgi:CRISPR-associated endonuclease/helicase Cas3